MIRGFIGSDADRIGPPEEAIRIRAIGSDPRLIADQSDPLGALFVHHSVPSIRHFSLVGCLGFASDISVH